MTSDRFIGGESSITQFVLTGECIVGPWGSSLRAACKCSGICSAAVLPFACCVRAHPACRPVVVARLAVADLLWRMPVLASLAGAKLKLAGSTGFAGFPKTLHARGPKNIKSPILNLLRAIGEGLNQTRKPS